MRRLSRVPLNGKQGNCGHTVAIFTFRPSGQNAKICLLGSLPKPGFGPTWPEESASLCSLFSHPLTFLLLLPARLRIAQQIINVRLYRRDLPHFLPCLPVLGIEPLFLLRQFPAFLLQPVHLWQLRPAQNLLEVGAGRPVELNVALMLRKELPAVFPGLVFLEHRPGPGILDRGRLQFPVGLEGCLGALDQAQKSYILQRRKKK